MTTKNHDNTGKLLTDGEISAMQLAIQAESLSAVAKACAAGEQSVTKAVAKIPVQRGTVALIREYLRSKSATSAQA